MNVLDSLAVLTEEAGRFDLAVVQFIAGLVGFFACMWAMNLVVGQADLCTPGGLLRVLQRIAIFLQGAALLINGSYPIYMDMQPWLPSVLLTCSVTIVVLLAGLVRRTKPRPVPSQMTQADG